jgi:hypothetical protein
MDIITADMKQGAYPQEVAVYYNLGVGEWFMLVIKVITMTTPEISRKVKGVSTSPGNIPMLWTY